MSCSARVSSICSASLAAIQNALVWAMPHRALVEQAAEGDFLTHAIGRWIAVEGYLPQGYAPYE